MGIIPCEIPLLEFDPEQTAVIGPDYEQLDLHLPRKCVFTFLGGYIDRYAHAAGARQVATFNSATRLYPIYVTTYHYAPPSRYMEISEPARRAIEQTILAHHMRYQEVVTWSTDGFFRETKEKVAYRKSEGCSVVEMECSALAACAAFRSATWGMLLYTADSLADVQRYDQRHWGGSAYEYALTLCLDAVLAL